MAPNDMTYTEEGTSLPPNDAENGAVEKSISEPPIEYLETGDEEELRSLIFQTSDVVERLIDVPEWKINGKTAQFLLRALNGTQRVEYITMMQKSGGDLTKAYPDLIILSTRHPVTKKLVFKPADRTALLGKLGNALERIAMNVIDLSGLDEKSLTSYLKK